ncbi:hypothetical protein PR202_gb02405 [Eleusine coracana subsp. coracana]|uniref:Uncharacterized protein n=1 Tax=Eleusine coracana subsp. coracana TaxID=191504 RepID=A0AAV5DZ94_ELECO|nr:hypothetical protein PR202_gb02405 [Eleusine coracana subsp. coracana]
MGRSPCCEKAHTNKGAWTKEEDERLVSYIRAHGEGCWRSLPKAAGLLRCGKSCRLRWINYLRPDLKRGNFTADEDDLIVKLHALLGNKWSLIAARLPGRTDNEIKNYWNTHIRRKLVGKGIDPVTHRPIVNNAAPTRLDDTAAIMMIKPSPPSPSLSLSPITTTTTRCPDLNLDLCISPPSPPSQEQQEDVKPVVNKREMIPIPSRHGGLCFGCSLGLDCNCGGNNQHFLGLRIGVLDFRGLQMK